MKNAKGGRRQQLRALHLDFRLLLLLIVKGGLPSASSAAVPPATPSPPVSLSTATKAVSSARPPPEPSTRATETSSTLALNLLKLSSSRARISRLSAYTCARNISFSSPFSRAVSRRCAVATSRDFTATLCAAATVSTRSAAASTADDNAEGTSSDGPRPATCSVSSSSPVKGFRLLVLHGESAATTSAPRRSINPPPYTDRTDLTAAAERAAGPDAASADSPPGTPNRDSSASWFAKASLTTSTCARLSCLPSVSLALPAACRCACRLASPPSVSLTLPACRLASAASCSRACSSLASR
eukprot:scaffold2409_cov121-Isochrysis_galbana.AAC.3